MKNILLLPVLFGLPITRGIAQQSSAPQPPAPCTQPCDPILPLQPPPYTMPCSTLAAPAAAQLPKGWKFKLPKKAQQLIDKQRQQVAQQTGITMPSADDLAKQLQQLQQPKLHPCPFPAWYKTPPAPKSNP